jgi:hypothetical protein
VKCESSIAGFEGVPPYRVVFRKETDRIENPWYPDGVAKEDRG